MYYANEVLEDDERHALAKHRASEGVAVLDVIRPEWRASINRTTFNIESGEQCVLGQTFGNFTRGVAALCEARNNGLIYWVETPELGFECDEYVDYDDLQRAWLEVLG